MFAVPTITSIQAGCFKKRSPLVIGALLSAVSVTALADIEPRFYPTSNLSQNTGLSFNPSIAITNTGTAVVAWNDNSYGNMEVMVSRTQDHGKTWSAPLNVSNNSGLSTFPTIEASPDGVLHMVYQDGDGGQSAIYYARSTNQGQSFSAPVKISASGNVAVNAHLSIDSTGNLYVAYSTVDTLYIARSSNSGNTFSVQTQQRVKNYVYPQLAIGQSESVHLTWVDNGEIFYALSTQGGRSFSRALNVSNTAGSSKAPSLGTDQFGNVYVTWAEEITKQNTDVYLIKSANNGTSFDTAVNVTNNSGYSIEPDLHVDANGNVHLAWQDTTPGNYEAVYAYSADHANTFTPMLNIAPSEFGSLVTKVKTDSDGNIYITWDDNRDGDFEATVVTGRLDIAAITAQASPETFTPNGDVVDDFTQITASFTEALDWTVSIENEAGVEVASLIGNGLDLDVSWDGTVDGGVLAPAGLYTYHITGLDADGYDAVPAEGVVELDDAAVPTTPEITFFDASPFLDPDGDGRRDTAIFEGTFNQSLDWVLELVDSDHNVVWSAVGSGISFNLVWAGLADNGMMTPDGDYTLELTASDEHGSTVSDTRPVTVDTVDPQWSNMVLTTSFSPNNDGVNDIATIDFDISEGALVTVYVFESNTGSLVRELFRNAFDAASHVSVSWDGLNGGGQAVAAGSYEYSIWIRDFAANRANPYPIRTNVTVE